jgi:hypothetical protein
LSLLWGSSWWSWSDSQYCWTSPSSCWAVEPDRPPHEVACPCRPGRRRNGRSAAVVALASPNLTEQRGFAGC